MKIWGFFICEMLKFNAELKFNFTIGLVLLYRSHVTYEIHCEHSIRYWRVQAISVRFCT